MSAEVEVETTPGLPHDVPAGERVLWQGRPSWRALARQTFKVRLLAGYFTVFGALRAVKALRDHEGLVGLQHVLIALGLAAACIGVLNLMAWLYARMTIYTITSKRIVMRIGVALPMTWNLPFKRLASADLTTRKDGDGDIALQLTAPNRIGWLLMWPHVQPWHYVKARPTLRTIPDAARVAALLAEAVRAWAEEKSAPMSVAAPSELFDATASSSDPTPNQIPVALATEAGR